MLRAHGCAGAVYVQGQTVYRGDMDISRDGGDAMEAGKSENGCHGTMYVKGGIVYSNDSI